MAQCTYAAQDKNGNGRWRCQGQTHWAGDTGQVGHTLPPNGAAAAGAWEATA